MEKYFEKRRYVSFLYKEEHNIIPKVIEYRIDKLFDRLTIINVDRSEYINKSAKNIIIKPNKSEKTCIFCKNNLLSNNNILLSKYENSAVMYNLYPYFEKHGLYIPETNKHVVDITELSWYHIYKLFKETKEDFFEPHYQENNRLKYIEISINHGIGAGASIEHIHFHLVQSEIPTKSYEKFLKISIEYFKKNKRNLLEDILNYEKKANDRFIFSGKVIEFFTPFAHYGHYEVFGIIKGFNVLNMAESRLKELSKELYSFIKCYRESLGIKYFNMIIYDPIYIKDPGIIPFVRIVGRPIIKNGENSIIYGFSEIMEQTQIIHYYPEDVARILRSMCNKYMDSD